MAVAALRVAPTATTAAARAEAGLLFAWAVIFAGARPGLGFVDVEEAWFWARAVAGRLGARACNLPVRQADKATPSPALVSLGFWLVSV